MLQALSGVLQSARRRRSRVEKTGCRYWPMAARQEGDTRHPRAMYGCRDAVSPHRHDEATKDRMMVVKGERKLVRRAGMTW